MKTKEELNALKNEVEALNMKLSELTEEELSQVVGGDVTSANIVGYVPTVTSCSPSGKEKDEQIIV